MLAKEIFLSNGESDGYEIVICDCCHNEINSYGHSDATGDYCDTCWEDMQQEDIDEDEFQYLTDHPKTETI
jgi:hypothetical protein